MDTNYFFSEFAKLHAVNIRRSLPQLNSYDFILYRFPEWESELEKARIEMHESKYASSTVDKFMALYTQCCFLVWSGFEALIEEYHELGRRSREEMEQVVVQRRISRARAIKEEQQETRGSKNRKTVQHPEQSLRRQETIFR